MSTCAKCGAGFDCGMVEANAPSPCWCTALPPLPAGWLGREAAACYCPACLRALLAAAQHDTVKI